MTANWNPDVDAFRKNAGNEEKRKFDSYVHAVTVISEPHRLSHDGMVFHASGKQLALANAASAEFAMVVPAGSYPHVQRVRLDLERGDIDLLMYEGATLSDNGTPIPTRNVNRNSPNTSLVPIFGAPTITDDGTLFHTHWVPPTGSGVGSSEGIMDVSAFGEEWILAPSTNYMWRITNNSGGTLDFRYEFVWYEVGYER